jgi:enoyl-CoA hydratase/carnithine racemase
MPVMGEAVRYERESGVAWLTMDRPENRNALSFEVRQGLWDGFRRFNADEAAAVMVLTGAGESAFCAGGDLKEMAEVSLRVPGPDFLPYPGRNLEVEKPLIAAVNGAAYGGGFLLAQVCDLCVAAEGAQFAISEARWGRGMPWAAPLPWLIPPRVALELLMTAEPIDARRAREIGLVNRVVPLADLHQEVAALAQGIARNAPLTLRAAKAMVYRVCGMSWKDALDEGDRLFKPVYLSDDAQEGPRAFREKREPRWRAR